MLTIINEKSTCVIRVSFFDEDNSPVTPDQAWYSLYCETTDTDLIAETSISELNSTVDIEVTPTQNRIINTANPTEIKVLTIRFTYNSDAKQGTGQYRYGIRNLRKIS